MNLYFRGARSENAGETRLGTLSFTPCLPVALVYSAQPADPFSGSKERRHAHFVPTSTVFAAKISAEPVLDLYSDSLSCSVGDVMRKLKYGKTDGITDEEVRKIMNYMNNRAFGKVSAGEFRYRVFDEDGEMYGERDEKPWALLTTGINYIRQEWDEDPSINVADRLAADTFVFADTPVVQKVAERLGFRGITYLDVFGGARYALRDLLGIDLDEEWDGDGLVCIENQYDIDDDAVYAHETLRPLPGADVDYEWQMPAEKVAADVRSLLGLSA